MPEQIIKQGTPVGKVRFFTLKITAEEHEQLFNGKNSGDFIAGWVLAKLQPVYEIFQCIFCFKALRQGESIVEPVLESGQRAVVHQECYEATKELDKKEELKKENEKAKS